jgi:hypothetical protein
MAHRRENIVLLEGLKDSLRCFSWEEREGGIRYSLRSRNKFGRHGDVAQFLKTLPCSEILRGVSTFKLVGALALSFKSGVPTLRDSCRSTVDRPPGTSGYFRGFP